MSATTEQTRIDAECRQDDLRSEAEALTWRLYRWWMATYKRGDIEVLKRIGHAYRRAMQRLFRRFGGEDAYWESVAI